MANEPRSIVRARGGVDRRFRGHTVLAALLLAAGSMTANGCGESDGQGRREAKAPVEVAEPAPRVTPNVLVAMHLEEPLDPNQTVVWTVAFQAAWDALTDAVRREGKLPGLDLGPPARPEDVHVLALGRLRPGIVAPKDLTVVAGPATKKTWESIDRESDRPRPSGAPAPREQDLAAFARLKAGIRYETPFHVETRPILFGSAKAPVRGYGLEADANGEAADRMRTQVRLHVGEPTAGASVSSRCVVVLTGSGGMRVVVSGRPPKATLAATWNEVATTVRSTPAESFGRGDSLAIPRVSIAATRSFDGFVGAEVVGMPGSRLALAQADVRLTADEKGADVDSAGLLIAVGSIPKPAQRVEFDGPFLLAMIAKGTDLPFALAWIGSADALSSWNEPVGRPLTKDESFPFVGGWRLDREASIEATVVRTQAVLGHESSRLSATDWANFRDRVREDLGGASFDVVVSPDGVATIETGRAGEPPRRDLAPVTADGARRVLELPKARSNVAGDDAEAATELSCVVTRDHDRLVLTPTSGRHPVRVLVRK